MSNVIKNKILKFEQNGFVRNKSKDEKGNYTNKYYMEGNNVTYIIIADKDTKEVRVKQLEKEEFFFGNDHYETESKETIKNREIMAQYGNIKAPKTKLEKY